MAKKRKRQPAARKEAIKKIQQPEIPKDGDKKSSLIKIGIPIVLLLAIYLLFFANEKHKSGLPASAGRQGTISQSGEPKFKKEGELTFIDQKTSQAIKKIAIEIADTPLQRQQGLMYRTTMPDSTGMLFIFERSEVRAFWMKDTYVPLDILFVNAEDKIVTIQSNTTPLSEESILSYRPSKYVVEVAAGFCDRYGVQEGDLIRF